MSYHSSENMFFAVYPAVFCNSPSSCSAHHFKLIMYSDAWMNGYLPISATAIPQQTFTSDKDENFLKMLSGQI